MLKRLYLEYLVHFLTEGKMKHTIGLSEYDGIRKMLNINYKGKVPSKAAVAENQKDLIIRKFSMLFIDLLNISTCTVVV